MAFSAGRLAFERQRVACCKLAGASRPTAGAETALPCYNLGIQRLSCASDLACSFVYSSGGACVASGVSMRAVVQRVRKARVVVGEEVVGEIGRGLLVLLGVAVNDSAEQAQWLADKVVGLRVFADADDKMNLSVADVQGAVLVVSQFTLYGDCRKGRRPSFIEAAAAPLAVPMYEAFCDAVRAQGVPVA